MEDKKIRRINCFGDSYCADPSEGGWIDVLAKKLNAEIGHLGRHGTGPDNCYKQFSNFLKRSNFDDETGDEDLYIFCWSDAERVRDVHERQLPDPYHTVPDITITPKYLEAVKLYHTYIHNVAMWENIFFACHDAVKYKCITRNLQNVQHFYCFRREQELVGAEFNLYDLAHREEDYGEEGVDDLEFPNHFSPVGSIKLAERIISNLNQGDYS